MKTLVNLIRSFRCTLKDEVDFSSKHGYFFPIREAKHMIMEPDHHGSKKSNTKQFGISEPYARYLAEEP